MEKGKALDSNLIKNGFPFGEEKSVSIQKLFTFFCNNLHLGQWGLARSCVTRLYEESELLQVDIRELLRNIAENPIGFW